MGNIHWAYSLLIIFTAVFFAFLAADAVIEKKLEMRQLKMYNGNGNTQ